MSVLCSCNYVFIFGGTFCLKRFIPHLIASNFLSNILHSLRRSIRSFVNGFLGVFLVLNPSIEVTNYNNIRSVPNSVYGCTEVSKERFISGREVDVTKKQFLWLYKDLNTDQLHLCSTLLLWVFVTLMSWRRGNCECLNDRVQNEIKLNTLSENK